MCVCDLLMNWTDEIEPALVGRACLLDGERWCFSMTVIVDEINGLQLTYMMCCTCKCKVCWRCPRRALTYDTERVPDSACLDPHLCS